MRTGWVYAAVSTVLVAVPVLGTAMARDQDDASTVFVTLNIPKNEGEAEPLTLRLDVGESQTACGQGNLTINGQPLAQDGNGNGNGALAVNEDVGFTANWAFSCGAEEEDMLLKLQVTELDGLEIAPFNFSTTFTQLTPRIYTVAGAAVVNRIHKVAQEPTQTETKKSLEELQSEIHSLDILRIKARQLENAIFAREDKIAELLGQKKTTTTTTPLKKKNKNIQDCDSLECIFNTLGGKFRGVAEKLGGDVEELKAFIAHSEDETLPVPEDYDYWYGEGEDDGDDVDAAEVYDLKDDGGKWKWVDQLPLTSGHVDDEIEYVRPLRRRQPPLVMAIAISVIALCFLSTYFILLLHRRTTKHVPIENEKVLFSERPARPQKPSRSEQRARRKARKQAIKEYINSIVTRWCRTTQQPPSPCLPTYESSSIEEEFASFREAVSVVDSLVAAEEGRNREVPVYTPYVGNVRDVFRDDESLPPYESEDESASPADGFHYRYFEGESGRDDDDRLGYGK